MKTECDEIVSFKNDYPTRKIVWKFLILLFGVAFLLILLNYLFLFLIHSQNFDQFTWLYLRLDMADPTITAIFFSNYFHDPNSWQHLVGNLLGFCVVICLNFFCYFEAIPYFKRRKKLYYEYPESAFFLTSVVFLLALPFAISGISILFGRLFGFDGVIGFSGILWAFVAYLFFLFILTIFDWISHNHPTDVIKSDDTQSNPSAGRNPMFNFGFLIFFISLVILVTMFVILEDLGNEKFNVFGHLAGFTIGLILSPLILVITQTSAKKQRLVLIGLCGLIILIPSISWLFI